MSDFNFSRFGAGIAKGRKQAQDMQTDRIDQATKMAALQEAGYSYDGNSLSREPGYVSTKALERQKLQAEVDRMKRPAFGGGSMPSNVKIKEYDEWGQPKAYEPADKLSSAQELAKDKATKEIFENYEMDNARRGTLDKAIAGAETVPQGWFGRQRIQMAQKFPSTKPLFGVNDQQIKDAQELKIALTQGTLAETAYTKGAISDQEMALFKEASANNDFNSPAIQPVLQKIREFVDAGQAGRFGAYKKNYGEDPKSWFGDATSNPPPASGGGSGAGEYSEDDILETMRANNMTRQQVLAALGA